MDGLISTMEMKSERDREVEDTVIKSMHSEELKEKD